MTDLLLALSLAAWLGIVTSVSPCPFATNVAAISLLSRQVQNRGRAACGAVAYTLGRILTYVVLALVLLIGLASAPALAAFLRQDIFPLVGPILILAGMVLLGWLPLPVNFRLGDSRLAEKLLRFGWWGELGLGALFALAFCPVSAALFFGSVLPIALASSFPSLAVAAYGLGTALPVGLVALLIVFGSGAAARTIGQIQRWQSWATPATGAVLALLGSYLTITHNVRPALAALL